MTGMGPLRIRGVRVKKVGGEAILPLFLRLYSAKGREQYGLEREIGKGHQ